jgi:drug/metabolite transporter (DMT)-like permease
VLYTLGALVVGLAGVALVRRPHRRLLALSAASVVLGYVMIGLGFLVSGGAALGVFYLGALVVLLGFTGVVVFGIASLRARRHDRSRDFFPPA